MTDYLMSGRLTELDRLQLQSLVWEPPARRLLAALGSRAGRRAVDVGCGCLGWLRVLSEWVGADGEVLGTDIDEAMLGAARELIASERLTNARIVRDDVFASSLPKGRFDLVHARFQIAPLGRAAEQVDTLLHLTRPGGVLVIEDPDTSTWRFDPPAPAAEQLIELILLAFRDAGGDFDAGRTEAGLLRRLGLDPQVRHEAIGLPPGHPYLRLPLQFAASLEPRLARLVESDELDRLRAAAEEELSHPGRRGTTFTLVQTWAVVP